MVSFTGYAFTDYGENIIILAAMAFFGLSICMDLELKKMWPWYVGLGALGVLFYYFQKQALILRIVLAILAGRKKDSREVVKVFFWGTLGVTFVTAVLSFFGVGRDFYVIDTFRHVDEIRYQFGFLHPNSFALFWFKVLVFGLYAYVVPGEKGKLPKPVLYGIAILFLAPLYFAKSKTAFALGGAAIVGFLACDLIRWKGFRTMLYIFGNALMAFEVWALFSCMTWLWPVEGKANKFWWFLNYLTTGRTHLIHTLHENVKPTWMGVSLGSDATEVGFVNALYNQGKLFIILYLIVLFGLFFWLYRRKNAAGMILVLAFTAYASAEAFLPYFNKNGVWFMLLGVGTYFSQKEKKENENRCSN
ncbi:MAG: hypothetical protein MJ105_08620 [Lachnospiraceae bacterium]|nr:hypothetical protein [Lachnospiraceae bacterium]